MNGRLSMNRVLGAALVTLASLLPAACGDDEPDAYGNFEADAVAVSAEAAGRLVTFGVEEGARLAAGAVVGRIDTTALALQRQELRAQQRSAVARVAQADAQVDVLEAQLATAVEEYERTGRLYAAEAATAQQFNRAEGEVRVLRERIAAARVQSSAASQEVGGAAARLDQIDERIADSQVRNPVPGTVLAAWVEAGEFVQVGQPLYEIADLSALTLRAYVSGAQLTDVRVGADVTVRVDAGADEYLAVPGTITWVASEAEFTPTPIQTRDERTDQVYAVDVRVGNPEGRLKIGMPGELLLREP